MSPWWGFFACYLTTSSMARSSMRSDWLMPRSVAHCLMVAIVAGCRRNVTALRVSSPFVGRPCFFLSIAHAIWMNDSSMSVMLLCRHCAASLLRVKLYSVAVQSMLTVRR